jgi:hypothetical protein
MPELSDSPAVPRSGTTYDRVTNIQESVVKVSSDLTIVLDLFTPKNQSTLDKNDSDFGFGGVMVLPDQSGPFPHLAVAAGKTGTMFLMTADNLGGYSPSKNNVLGAFTIGNAGAGNRISLIPTSYHVSSVVAAAPSKYGNLHSRLRLS